MIKQPSGFLPVAFSQADVRTYCVSFEEAEIGGDELLVRAGVQPVMAPEGAVCAIGGQGRPADDCFCSCPFLGPGRL